MGIHGRTVNSERRFWFEVPPYADVLDPAGARWNVGEYAGQLQPAILTNYDNPPRIIRRNIEPHDSVTLALPDMGDAIAALAMAGFAMQVIE